MQRQQRLYDQLIVFQAQTYLSLFMETGQ